MGPSSVSTGSGSGEKFIWVPPDCQPMASATKPSADRPAARLRVLTLVDGIGIYGGGESLAREITQRLDPARYESTYCVTRWEPLPKHNPALDELRAAGVEFMGLDHAARIDPRPWRPGLRRLPGRHAATL